MYTQLDLSNFRGFKNFSMELKPLTLITGKNNTGKSSILDSLFLFQDYTNPDVFLKLLGFRGIRQIDLSSKSIWEPLFHNMDTKEPLAVRLNNELSLCLQKNNEYRMSVNTKDILNSKVEFSSTNYALSCDFERKEKRFVGDYVIGNEIILSGRGDSAIEPNEEYIQYLGPNTTLDGVTVADWFGQIELSRDATDKKKLIEILSILDDDIVDITTIAINRNVQLYLTNRQNVKIPVHTSGDGFKKVLFIPLAILAKPRCILLIDEVENGLHYSLHAKFWEMISTLAIRENCQIIATTHSYECISGALDGVKAAGMEDSFAFVRLDKSDKGVVPKTYTGDMLERALGSDWEVR